MWLYCHTKASCMVAKLLVTKSRGAQLHVTQHINIQIEQSECCTIYIRTRPSGQLRQ